MTRRTAFLALLSALAGVKTASAQVSHSQPIPPDTPPVVSGVVMAPKGRLWSGEARIRTRHFVCLDDVAGIELTYHGETLSFDMAAIWAALKAQP